MMPDDEAKTRGIAVGQAAAAAILAERHADGATTFVPYTPDMEPGDWQPTPNPSPADPPGAADLLPAVLPGWGHVVPFVLPSSGRFPPDDPPALTSEDYARDYNGVNRTKVRKVSHDFSIISYINTLGDWQLLGFVAFPSTFGGHIFFATHCQI
jgi:hypothetical protein